MQKNNPVIKNYILSSKKYILKPESLKKKIIKGKLGETKPTTKIKNSLM